ncbi:MAG: transcriptional repressor [Chloroflexi bacterium]|nr:transcriptional repressor [Chloroflexota bacterium]
MPHYPDTLALLRRQGLRITPQRMMILDILQHSDRHLSAEEVCALIQERFPSTDISTVYRTLELLLNLGMVQKTTLGEAHDHYEWVEDPHYHIVCQRCGAIMPFGDEVLDHLRALLAQQHQFRVARAYLEVFGTCVRCEGAQTEDLRDGIPSHQH